MDSCLALIRAHQHGITVGSMNGENPRVFFFFFSGALDLDLVLQWSVQWPSDIKILNRAGVQWLCRATPEGGYTSTPKSPRNRTWPPGNVPRPNGAPKQSGVLGLLQGNGSHSRGECKHCFKRQLHTTHVGTVRAGNRTAVLPRHARGRRIRTYPELCTSKFNKVNLKQGAHMPWEKEGEKRRPEMRLLFVGY